MGFTLEIIERAIERIKKSVSRVLTEGDNLLLGVCSVAVMGRFEPVRSNPYGGSSRRILRAINAMERGCEHFLATFRSVKHLLSESRPLDKFVARSFPRARHVVHRVSLTYRGKTKTS